METDTILYGVGSSNGWLIWSLTLTYFHSGWTETSALWGNRGGEVRVGLEHIEKRLPIAMLGFDCNNGNEFLHEIKEKNLYESKAILTGAQT